MPCYSKGTFAIAKSMGDGTQKGGLLSIIGGGDSASAAELSGEASRMSHVSTGGGASLELLEGKTLPGVAVLTDKKKSTLIGDGSNSWMRMLVAAVAVALVAIVGRRVSHKLLK